MMMSPAVRKLVRTMHITFAVGWFGAVAVFLALAVIGVASPDPQRTRAAYLVMEPIARFVIVPLSFAPLITGPILSLFTPWGLFRHYWILVKLLITIGCTVILLVHMPPIMYLASGAAENTLSQADLRLRIQMVVASAAALLALLATTALAVYKPRGLTRYGWRKQKERRKLASTNDSAP